MISRSSHAIILFAVLVATAATGCTPATGALGTPATPDVTNPASGGPTPSDALPASASPSVGPSTSAPSPGPTASTSPGGSPTSSPSTAPTQTPAPTATPATTIVRAYFFLDSFSGNEGLVPVLREVSGTKAVATAAMRALLDGPNTVETNARPGMSTAIPAGTRLLDLSIKSGLATVDLSGAFASGGGSASVLGRLAQVVYTLTQFSTVDKVTFELDGTPVTMFSGEGVVLDHPVGRADFQDQLPAIFVDRPAWGASIGNPGRVSGLANVFEATFRVQLLNGSGRVLAERQVMASCGTGCWGAFQTELAYTVAKSQYGTLMVYDLSAKDGSLENLTEYRVWLTPAG